MPEKPTSKKPGRGGARKGTGRPSLTNDIDFTVNLGSAYAALKHRQATVQAGREIARRRGRGEVNFHVELRNSGHQQRASATLLQMLQDGELGGTPAQRGIRPRTLRKVLREYQELRRQLHRDLGEREAG